MNLMIWYVVGCACSAILGGFATNHFASKQQKKSDILCAVLLQELYDKGMLRDDVHKLAKKCADLELNIKREGL